MKTLAEKIEVLLKKHNMSQRELAEKCDVTEASVSKYITLGRIPRADVLGKIAVALGVTADWIFRHSSKLSISSVKDVFALPVIKFVESISFMAWYIEMWYSRA